MLQVRQQSIHRSFSWKASSEYSRKWQKARPVRGYWVAQVMVSFSKGGNSAEKWTDWEFLTKIVLSMGCVWCEDIWRIEGDGKMCILELWKRVEMGGWMDSYLILIPAQPSIVVSSSALHLRPLFLLTGFFHLGWTKEERNEDEMGKEERDM